MTSPELTRLARFLDAVGTSDIRTYVNTGQGYGARTGTVPLERASDIRQIAAAHDVPIDIESRGRLHIHGCAPAHGDPAWVDRHQPIRLTVNEYPQHDMNISVARTLLAWNTLLQTGQFPPVLSPHLYADRLDDPTRIHIVTTMRPPGTPHGRARPWAEYVTERDTLAVLRELDTTLALDARTISVDGPFGSRITPADPTEELLARLISDRTGDDPMYVRPGVGTPDPLPDVLAHSDLLGITLAERALTIRTSRDAHAPGVRR